MSELLFNHTRVSWLELFPAEIANMDDHHKWKTLAKEHLKRSLLGKACIALNGPVQEWSLSRFYSVYLNLKVDRVRYAAILFQQLTLQAIDDIVNSPDFEMARLWVVLWANQSEVRLEALIKEQHNRGIRPPCTQESLTMMCDEVIYWVNPTISDADIEPYVTSLAANIEWSKGKGQLAGGW
jgi:hypothetical protein